VVLEALAAQSHSGNDEANDFADFRRVMPGLGEPCTLTLRPQDRAVGCTLKDLNVRGLTGATVLAIERKPNEVVFPGPDERLREHDVVVLTGTRESVEAAIALLRSAPAPTLSGTDGDLVG
jgi:CPA2 family monovalent cation:H+ antiporter-2